MEDKKLHNETVTQEQIMDEWESCHEILHKQVQHKPPVYPSVANPEPIDQQISMISQG